MSTRVDSCNSVNGSITRETPASQKVEDEAVEDPGNGVDKSYEQKSHLSPSLSLLSCRPQWLTNVISQLISAFNTKLDSVATNGSSSS